jgi:hypothetical protein
MGCRTQLTFFNDSISSARPCPNPNSRFSDSVLFNKDKGREIQTTIQFLIYQNETRSEMFCSLLISVAGGNEEYQIYHLNLTSGKIHMLTDGISRNTDIVWNNQGTL